ncbi:hypothetical protein Tco_1012531 [Tanacetum coccineum]
MPFAMLLTRLYNHILTTNPQAIVLIARFTFHKHAMDPLDISRNPSTEKGKKITSPPVISSSSSSSDDNEAPSFLEFYDELSDIPREAKMIMLALCMYALVIIMVNVIPPDHIDDVPVVEPNQHDDVLVVPEPVLEDEDEDPEEEEFEEEKEP